MLEKMPDNIVKEAIKDLKNSNIPVCIWGGGKLAEKIKKFCDEREIRVDRFLVNMDYWNCNQITKLENLPVDILERYLEGNKCNLIVAFAGYTEGQLKQYRNRVDKIYAIDFMGILCMEEFESSMSIEFYEENKREIQWLEDHLNDGESKKALEEYIVQRISGNYMKENYEWNQYFPEKIICLEENEIFLDCGAYHGESAIDFINQIQMQGKKNYEKIICIEADRNNVLQIKKELEEYGKVDIISAGVWDSNGILRIDAGHDKTSRISEYGNEIISVKTIDSILEGGRITYIKMDIEGSELKALQGAKETIKKYKPKLAICIYHKPEDLIEIPKFIYELRSDYKFYIRNHSPYGIETVLYAI